MIVEEQNVITITYELREDGPEGEVLERTDLNHPFKFLFGTGRLLPDFERNLEGLHEQDGFEFTLPPDQAYGEVETDNVVEVPMEVFRDETGQVARELLVKDNFIALTDNTGETHHGKILDWNDEAVTIDFNHALAGKSLHFKGTILNIRKATVDELVRQHYIEEDGLRNPDFGEGDSEWWNREV